jgi:antibiotic biosynthesis monooxygenase (ABM) superfamily enzyme
MPADNHSPAKRRHQGVDAVPTTLDTDDGYVTVINTYTVAPERAEELLDLLVTATNDTLRHVPGFVSANFHLNGDQSQVVNYAQWRSLEELAAAREDPEVVARIGEAGKLAGSFTPVLYVLRATVAAP